jgi:hypothetical protein
LLARAPRPGRPSQWQQTWQLGVDALIARADADSEAVATLKRRPRSRARTAQRPAKRAA